MLQLDLSSKRARLALRFFTYGAMTLATILLTVAAVFYAMGYRFNQNDLSFEQGGLLQFRSTPGGAQVVVDGKTQSFTTPGRLNLATGEHTVEMRASGYRPWQKTVTLAAGQLLWLNYTRLFPDTITTTKAATFDGVAGALASPDRKWMVVQLKSDQPVLKLVDFSDSRKPVTTDLTIPEGQLTKKDGAYGQFSLKEWDLNSRYLLVEHVNKDIREIIRVDRQRAPDALNVSRVFSLVITEAHFAGGNANVLFAKTDGVLRRLDIGASTASAVLINGIEQFMVYGDDTIAFVAMRDDGAKQRVVGMYTQGKETTVRTFAPETTMTIAYSEYIRHAYLAITTGDGTVKILRDPTIAKDNVEVAVFKTTGPATWMRFSGSGRILLAGNTTHMSSYDLELDSHADYPIPGAPLKQPPQWLDDYYVWTDAGGTARLFEYDGTNGRDIVGVTEGFIVSLSQDGAFLYSFIRSPADSFDLQSSQLVLNN